MSDCCRGSRKRWDRRGSLVTCFYPDPPCPPEASLPRAEDAPWTVYDNIVDRNPSATGSYAEKVVGVVTIGAEVDGNGNAFFGTPPGNAPSSWHPNALSVTQDRIAGNSHANMRFTVDVPQPGMTVRVIDLDRDNNETLRTGGNPFASAFGPYNLGEADAVIPLAVPNGQGANSIAAPLHAGGQGGPGYAAPNNLNDVAADLIYADHPWGDDVNGAPAIVTGFVLSPGSGIRGSQYDFSGGIWQEPCSLGEAAIAEWCCGEVVWRKVDGTELTEDEQELLGPCDSDAPSVCDLIDPATLPWTNNGDGTWSKDLGSGFVITGEHIDGTYAANIGQGLCTPSAPGSMLAFQANPCVGGSGGPYSANSPVGIRFTATRDWPAPFALRVFDIDGNSNTAKHAGPNETVAPSWGIPDSVEGPHASTYRDKGAGQIGANGAPADGRDFTLVYNTVPPTAPMDFNWHGCCLAFDFAIPASCD